MVESGINMRKEERSKEKSRRVIREKEKGKGYKKDEEQTEGQ